jgi:hypothetical protein
MNALISELLNSNLSGLTATELHALRSPHPTASMDDPTNNHIERLPHPSWEHILWADTRGNIISVGGGDDLPTGFQRGDLRKWKDMTVVWDHIAQLIGNVTSLHGLFPSRKPTRVGIIGTGRSCVNWHISHLATVTQAEGERRLEAITRRINGTGSPPSLTQWLGAIHPSRHPATASMPGHFRPQWADVSSVAICGLPVGLHIHVTFGNATWEELREQIEAKHIL